MARLSHQQWHNIRMAWEESARPGYAWLTAEGGGPWPITREGVRIRALKENWRKLPGVVGAVPQSDGPADSNNIGRNGFDDQVDERESAGTESTRQCGTVHRASGFTELNDDERLDLQDRHKREWGSVARGLLYDLAKEAKTATGVDKARIVKAFIDCLRVMQQVEAVLHGLATLDVDWDNLSVEELKAIYEKGRLPR